MKVRVLIFTVLLGSVSVFAQNSELIELTAAKDNFGRSNKRHNNSGAAPLMIIAAHPGIVSIVSFDLSTVTNEIETAEFSFRIMETSMTPVSFTVAPMAHNEQNGKWVEGAGNLGVQGRNARVGESTFQWRKFRDRQWLNAKERPVTNLMDNDLWEPAISKLSSVEWNEGEWITVKINDVSFLEEIRNHEVQMITFGLWGTGGNEVYRINTKESGHPAKLNLTVKVPPQPVSE